MQCDTESRRSLVRDSNEFNGIDYIEVLTSSAIVSPSSAGSDPYQALLIVRCFHTVINKMDGGEVSILIEGGSRLRNIAVQWVVRADKLKAASPDSPQAKSLSAEEKSLLDSMVNPDRVLLVRPSSRGDFSTYVLKIVQSENPSLPPNGFDAVLSMVEFSFKVECPSEFDCSCGQEQEDEAAIVPAKPHIDYMAKDYSSFRKLLLDRLAVEMPEWTERSPADMGVALVELLAYVGDHLSYYQDAVATEAYLGTARTRVSIRRHARLLDYYVHEGCNARAWVCIDVNKAVAEKVEVPEGTKLLVMPKGRQDIAVLKPKQLGDAVAQGADVFETMHPATFYSAHNKIQFYTWGDKGCYLEKGATGASLKNDDLKLKPGDVLVLEEVLVSTSNPDSEKNAQKYGDRSRRHAVRLTSIAPRTDELTKTNVLDVTWDARDALPFPLCVTMVQGDDRRKEAVARGNVVLADHGNTISELSSDNTWILPAKVSLGTPPLQGVFHPKLPGSGGGGKKKQRLTFAAPFDPLAPAADAFEFSPRRAMPKVSLEGDGHTWKPVTDLLNSDPEAAEFVVEVEDDGAVYLRFGDEETKSGMVPYKVEGASGKSFEATYRTGCGTSGNVGAEAITAIVWGTDEISQVRNPMEASGGTEPEDIEQVRQLAPGSFLSQERAVKEEDYEEILGRLVDIQKAKAIIRWTGSWHTVFVAIDRTGGLPVDPAYESFVRGYLEKYRMAGYDIEVHGASYVPLYIALKVNVKKGYFQENVHHALLQAFASGAKGFFNPDNFTFGKPVYLSQIYATAERVEGVESIEVERFEVWGQTKTGTEAIDEGVIKPGRFEIIRLDNNPNYPENGKIEFSMEGGI